MSEISVLSNQYKAVVDTTDQVNNSIIALKKRFLSSDIHKVENKQVKLSDDDLKSASDFLIKFLGYIISIKGKDFKESDFLPNPIIKEFYNRIEKIDPFFDGELRKIIELISSEKNLNKNQFFILDKMASALDNERTVLFRKLRTARG